MYLQHQTLLRVDPCTLDPTEHHLFPSGQTRTPLPCFMPLSQSPAYLQTGHFLIWEPRRPTGHLARYITWTHQARPALPRHACCCPSSHPCTYRNQALLGAGTHLPHKPPERTTPGPIGPDLLSLAREIAIAMHVAVFEVTHVPAGPGDPEDGSPSATWAMQRIITSCHSATLALPCRASDCPFSHPCTCSTRLS